RVRVLAYHGTTPLAGTEILLRQAPQITTWPIRHPHPWREPHGSAGAADPIIQFPVLGTMQRLVVPLHPLQRRTPERTEVHSVHRARLPTKVETSTTDTVPTVHRNSHCLLEWFGSRRGHDPANIVRPGLHQHRHRRGHVRRREDRMPIHSDDHIISGLAQ